MSTPPWAARYKNWLKRSALKPDATICKTIVARMTPVTVPKPPIGFTPPKTTITIARRMYDEPKSGLAADVREAMINPASADKKPET
jgi:hypothetical protein